MKTTYTSLIIIVFVTYYIVESNITNYYYKKVLNFLLLILSIKLINIISIIKYSIKIKVFRKINIILKWK